MEVEVVNNGGGMEVVNNGMEVVNNVHKQIRVLSQLYYCTPHAPSHITIPT